MHNLFDRLHRLMANVMTSGLYGHFELEVTRKIILLNIVCATGIVILIPMGMMAFVQGNATLGSVDLAMAVVLVINLVYLRKSGRFQQVAYFNIALVTIFFLYLLLTGGVSNSGFLWYYTFPLFALFLLGTAKGSIATLVLFVPAVIFFALKPQLPFITTYPTELVSRFIPSFLVVFAYSYVFESMRAKTHRQLIDKNDTLAATIAELEQTQTALKSARDKLEQRVRERTLDLQTANSDLQQEIRQRRRVEQALQSSNDRFVTVLDSVDANIYVADIETHEILFVNQKMLDHFGPDLVGKPCWQAVRGQAGVCAACTNKDLFDDDGNPRENCVWEDQNPLTARWYLNHDRAIVWIDGRYVRLQVSTDVTERKEAEMALQKLNNELEAKVTERTGELASANQELQDEIAEHRRTAKALQKAKVLAEKANQTKSDFLANMSHELRTPLNHIIGFTEIVVDKHFGALNDTQEEYLKNVLQSSRHLLELVNDILDLSKIEAGKLQLMPAPCALKPLLHNSLTMVKEKALKHRLALQLHAEHLPDTFMADERKLKQILYNLLSNAVKFTPDGGSVHISVKSVPKNRPNGRGNTITFSVADSGIGIKAEDLERIFEPFEQADTSSSRHFQGTGLGLSLTKRLVELHGGKIWVESPGEGRGSVFHFTIPASPPPSSA